MSNNEARRQPGWPEAAAALMTYLVLIAALGLWMVQTPSEQAALRGIVGMGVNGIAGVAALLAAFALRLRDFHAFGFRMTKPKWLAAGAALGIFAFGLSFLIEAAYFRFITEPNTQADFQAAASGGTLSLLALLLAGAVFTPFGEEVVFRGVIASALNRYGPWAGVVGSASIFAVVHGPSVILLDAFMVGILTGLLFRKTGSLWPPFAIHAVYNALHLLYYATL
ncbi:CPBP family intramembrane metalloprotease [[Pseudomonas] carboxydohydrogena]|uniref:CPBP family intramembrane metalloprotease n=1 Tax=Afipia carboxydohydrogena TaxID=290 RepID=A0ABY8BLF6_AFICR|nr:type II CAAX endopeptidase family protein [[Pseudomonas] carboxydohydrogena]WEF50206.1 CPBP family intramembrane metalloprotease [[Pseudomonas] carboxydohydrogena]